MESQLSQIGDISYQKYAEKKSNKLDINYCNSYYGEQVVPLVTVIKILKDIELRLDSARCNIDCDSDEFEMVDNIYQDI